MSEPVTVDLERWGRAKISIALVLCIVLGGGALVGAATGQVDGGTASVVIAVVLGALILLVGGGICLFLVLDPPHATVTLDAGGIRHTRGKRADWSLTWDRIASAEVTHSDLQVENRGISTTGGYQHPSTDVTLARDWLRIVPRSGEPIALDLGPDAGAGSAVRSALAAFAPPAARPAR